MEYPTLKLYQRNVFSANVIAKHQLGGLLFKRQPVWLREMSQKEITEAFCVSSPYLSKEGGKSLCVIFNAVKKNLVYIMLKTKVTPYVVPTESHYNASV